MAILPNMMGFKGKTGGSKTLVSAPKKVKIIPLKKNESPTVIMITLSTGSPIIGRSTRCSVNRPRMTPVTRVKNMAKMKVVVTGMMGVNHP